MDLLLDLAERQRIDFGRMSILALAEQFVAAMAQFGDRVPIERRADWLVLATRLVLLRSRLLFPESPMAADAAERDAAAELRRIDDLAEARAAAAWLGDRPMLGQDVFARGAPEHLGEHLGHEHAVDVIAFLWASMALFEDDADQPETVALYRPRWTDLYSVAEARARILRMLGEGGGGETLGHFLREPPSPAEPSAANPLRLSSAWATTFSASLEPAKLGPRGVELLISGLERGGVNSKSFRIGAKLVGDEKTVPLREWLRPGGAAGRGSAARKAAARSRAGCGRAGAGR